MIIEYDKSDFVPILKFNFIINFCEMHPTVSRIAFMFGLLINPIFHSIVKMSHQWPRDSVFKTGRREVLG